MATTHYVCTGGCLTVKYSPGKCIKSGCPRHRNPLTECNCEDGLHGDLLFRNHPNGKNLQAQYESEHKPQAKTKTKSKSKPKTKKV